MKLALDLAGDQKPTSLRVNGCQPERVDRTSVSLGLFEWAWWQFADDAIEEFLAEFDFSGSVSPAGNKHEPTEDAQDDPRPRSAHLNLGS
jgi:hypothetical protein